MTLSIHNSLLSLHQFNQYCKSYNQIYAVMPVIYQMIICKTISFFSTFPNFFHKCFFHHKQHFQTCMFQSLFSLIVVLNAIPLQKIMQQKQKFPQDHFLQKIFQLQELKVILHHEFVLSCCEFLPSKNIYIRIYHGSEKELKTI